MLDALADRLSTRTSRSCATAWNVPSATPRSATWSAGTWRPWSKPPRGTAGRPSKSLTLEQAQALLHAARDSHLHPYVVLSVMTGLRTEELRALRWNEVDLDAGTVAVYRAARVSGDTKTRKSRRVQGLLAMVTCSSGDSVRGFPSIMGSSRCLTRPSRSPIQPSVLLPHTTGASIAAMTFVGQVLLVARPSGPAVVRSKDRSGPSNSTSGSDRPTGRTNAALTLRGEA
jgi:hypothetical protein